MMCLELVGKYVSLYNSICKGFLKGETTDEFEKFKYCWSMVSTGSCGNILGGSIYSSEPLYFLVGATLLS